jgi:Glycoside hydrolase family 2 C-terminal domain 5/Domain of unknown function (DUF4982)
MLYCRVVWGDSPLELLVERPTPPGKKVLPAAWSWYDELESWRWDVPAGQPLTARAYTTGDRVRLLLNGKLIASVAVGHADQRTATFTVPHAHGTLVAVAYRGSREIGRKTLRTVGAPARLRLRSDVPRLKTDRDVLAHVFVDVLDEEGRLVPDALVKVTLHLSGGKLAGFSNGNPQNADTFKRPRRWTYLGQALAVICRPKSPGKVTITATAKNLQSAAITPPCDGRKACERRDPSDRVAPGSHDRGHRARSNDARADRRSRLASPPPMTEPRPQRSGQLITSRQTTCRASQRPPALPSALARDAPPGLRGR